MNQTDAGDAILVIQNRIGQFLCIAGLGPKPAPAGVVGIFLCMIIFMSDAEVGELTAIRAVIDSVQPDFHGFIPL